MNSSFDWNRLGDINIGRQNLGDEMPVVVYRLLLTTMEDVLVSKFGETTCKEIFREAGYNAGIAFAENVLDSNNTFTDFVLDLTEKLKQHKIGVLRFEKSDLENFSFTITISEDLDCSGLPITGETVCTYDEGFIAGLFKYHTGKDFKVEEVDCWASGDRTCRFVAKEL